MSANPGYLARQRTTFHEWGSSLQTRLYSKAHRQTYAHLPRVARVGTDELPEAETQLRAWSKETPGRRSSKIARSSTQTMVTIDDYLAACAEEKRRSRSPFSEERVQ